MDITREKALEYLEQDCLSNIPTLKFATLYPSLAQFDIETNGDKWALCTTFPAASFAYDALTYPYATKVAFLNGNDPDLYRPLLARIHPEVTVLKVSEHFERELVPGKFQVSMGNRFLSYTKKGPLIGDPHPVVSSDTVTDEVLALFRRNSHTPEEVRAIFAGEARWFGVEKEGKIVSACFTFRNYQNVWEIASVWTVETERQHGYGGRIVSAVLDYLIVKGYQPRYHVDVRNVNSIALAERLGMHRFLTLQHWVLTPR